ncbi:MAG TPA: ATP synthase F1 subunit epsilon [Bdellovibrio sp.]|uniref:ATP synthase F1 subunit epsilon n=1 Tax=Bdellovibrio sp. TaxID=28201 RepID=UPI002F092CA7
MFKLTIVTPERRLLVDQEVEEVTVPGFKGELNILPGHAPLITTLGTGVMKWRLKGQERQNQAVISWGYCQVSPAGVNVLANIAELPEEIDVQATKDFLTQSEKHVMNDVISETEFADIQRDWARARAKLEIAEGAPKK